MSINTIVERKQRKAASQKTKWELRSDLGAEFLAYVEANHVEELHNLFPSVVIGNERSSIVLAVTYSPSTIAGFDWHTSGSHTHNVALDIVKDQFNIGYDAHGSSGNRSITIPFDISTLNKTKKKKLFKDIIKALVSQAYWAGYKNDRTHQVWKGIDRIK